MVGPDIRQFSISYQIVILNIEIIRPVIRQFSNSYLTRKLQKKKHTVTIHTYYRLTDLQTDFDMVAWSDIQTQPNFIAVVF